MRTPVSPLQESKEEKRKKCSEELKNAGNAAFHEKNYSRAEEYYTSAILQWDKNHVIFTNRAQTRIKLGRYQVSIRNDRWQLALQP